MKTAMTLEGEGERRAVSDSFERVSDPRTSALIHGQFNQPAQLNGSKDEPRD